MFSLFVALGNPGLNYAATRHNAGWIAIDAFADRYGAGWRVAKKFNSLIAEISVGGQKLYLLKPQTFMNLSGEAVMAFLQFYKLSPSAMLVIHDDVAFEGGLARLSFGGSAGGHNGVSNVIERVGSGEFWRLRLGVGPRNPLLSLTDWVLGDLTQTEQAYLKSPLMREVLTAVIENGPEKTQNTLNGTNGANGVAGAK